MAIARMELHGPWALAEQIRRARTSLWLSVERAADLLEVPAQTLDDWEQGRTEPDDEQLWRLSEFYGRPVSYFFSLTGDPPPHQDFRADRPIDPVEEVASRRTFVARFEELCRAQAELEALLEERRTPRLITALETEHPRQATPDRVAEWLRARLGLESRPIKDAVRWLESLGIRVFTVDVPVDGFSGTSWWHPEFGPAVLLNRRDGRERRNFTAAHELWHLLLARWQVLCGFLRSDVSEEARANSFAAELLMPTVEVREKASHLRQLEVLTDWSTKDTTLDQVARHFGVSREAASWRLESLEILPSGFTASRRPLWKHHFYRGRTGKRWQHRLADLGSRHVQLAQQAYQEGRVSLSALASALQLDIDDAYDLALSSESAMK